MVEFKFKILIGLKGRIWVEEVYLGLEGLVGLDNEGFGMLRSRITRIKEDFSLYFLVFRMILDGFSRFLWLFFFKECFLVF